MKFLTPDGKFDVESFKHAVDVMITAQEILVDNASYPTERIAKNSHDFRPLGLGYANLGALLMANGLPYDSDGGRDYAAAITALMHGEAYLQSSRIAGGTGALRGLPGQSRLLPGGHFHAPPVAPAHQLRATFRRICGKRPRRPGTIAWPAA